MSAPLFEISNLHVVAAASPASEILRGLDLTINEGEIHAVQPKIGMLAGPKPTTGAGRVLARNGRFGRLSQSGVKCCSCVTSCL